MSWPFLVTFILLQMPTSASTLGVKHLLLLHIKVNTTLLINKFGPLGHDYFSLSFGELENSTCNHCGVSLVKW